MNRRNFLKSIGIAAASTSVIKTDIIPKPETKTSSILNFPTLSEDNSRINRVGMTRIDLEDQISDYGCYIPYNKRLLNLT